MYITHKNIISISHKNYIKSKYGIRGKQWKKENLIIGQSLKQEDKGRRDPSLPIKKKKGKGKKKMKMKSPPELNPYEEDFREMNLMEEFEQEYKEQLKYMKHDGFDVSEIVGNSDFQQMFDNLDAYDSDDEDGIKEGINEKNTNKELNEKNINKELNEKNTKDKIIKYRDSDGMDVTEEDINAAIDLSEDESKEFLNQMSTLNMDNILEKEEDFLEQVEEEIKQKRPEEQVNFGQSDEGSEWKDPIDKMAIDVANILFPRRGQRDHKQNWDHRNVSEEVLRKRAEKKARGYSIWLNIEISKSCNEAMEALKKTKFESKEAKEIVNKCFKSYAHWIKYHYEKLNNQNIVTMIQRIGVLTDKTKLKTWVLLNFKSLLRTLFGMIEERFATLKARDCIEVIWVIIKFGPSLGIMSNTHNNTSTSLNSNNNMMKTEDVNIRDLYYDLIFKVSYYDLNSKDIAMLAYSIANYHASAQVENISLEGNDVAALEKILRESTDKVFKFNSQDLSNMFWSIAKLRLNYTPEFMSELLRRTEEIINSFVPQGISNIIYSFAKISEYSKEMGSNFQNLELWSKIMKMTEDNLNHFKAQEISNTLWGLSKLRYMPSAKFLNKIANKCIMAIDKYTDQNISNIIISYATFYYQHPGLIGTIRSKLMYDMKNPTLQSIMNTARSLAILDLLDMEFLNYTLNQINNINEMSNIELMQIYQCIIHLNILNNRQLENEIISEDFKIKLKEIWLEGQLMAGESFIVKNVCDVLETLEYKIERNIDINGYFRVSVVHVSGAKYVIECLLDETRFFNIITKLIGRVVWREKIFISLGYYIMRIDPVKWNEFETLDAKAKYLKTII